MAATRMGANRIRGGRTIPKSRAQTTLSKRARPRRHDQKLTGNNTTMRQMSFVGGSPCQAFSIAGLRKALDDPRGQLMLEYLRACAEIDPEWIVWENVPGVLSAEHGRAFQSLLEAVAELWPDGGGRHGECWTLSSSVWPSDASVCSLSSTLETGDVPPRF